MKTVNKLVAVALLATITIAPTYAGKGNGTERGKQAKGGISSGGKVAGFEKGKRGGGSGSHGKYVGGGLGTRGGKTEGTYAAKSGGTERGKYAKGDKAGNGRIALSSISNKKGNGKAGGVERG